MKQFFYIMGKSATGKDTIYKKLKEKMDMNSYLLYTTRPMRQGEKDGVDYHFVTDEKMREYEEQDKIIEIRKYNTVKGIWKYATVADEQFQQEGNILTVGTLESYQSMRSYFQKNSDWELLPIYIEIPEEERRKRAIEREKKQLKPDYEEMERRLHADNQDFSEEKIRKAGIKPEQRFTNDDLEICVSQIQEYMEGRAYNAHQRFAGKYKVELPKKNNGITDRRETWENREEETKEKPNNGFLL